jgi:uncharacterized cupredoxin-like copper-binding protein
MDMFKKRVRVHRFCAAASLFLVAVLLAACGGGSSDNSGTTVKTSDQQASGAVNASLGEFYIKPDKTSVPAGKVRFTVINKGAIKHEFVVIKTNLAPDKLPVNGNEADESVGPSPGEIGNLPPGKTSHLAVNLTAGNYVLICNLPGHYKSGQRAGLSAQ